MRARENFRAGLSPEMAWNAASRQSGGAELIKEECREERGIRRLENLIRDIRIGARQLRKNPGVTTVALITMALSLGANLAIFPWSVPFCSVRRLFPSRTGWRRCSTATRRNRPERGPRIRRGPTPPRNRRADGPRRDAETTRRTDSGPWTAFLGGGRHEESGSPF